MDEITQWVDGLLDRTPGVDINKDTSLETVLKGEAIELWMDRAGRLFLVADELDVALVMKRDGGGCGDVYAATESRRIVRITGRKDMEQIHSWKRAFNAMIH